MMFNMFQQMITLVGQVRDELVIIRKLLQGEEDE